MKSKVTVSLDTHLLNFLNSQASGNRSEYISVLLAKQQQRQIEADLINALQQDAVDTNYQSEISEWDCVVGDGIDAAG